MGRLRTLTILLTLGAWGAATEGAPPSDSAVPAGSATRPPAPVPPVKYLEAGARLFNSGQYPLAAKYLGAAQTYRDQLTSSEQTVLDAYLKEMANTAAGTASATAPAATVSAAAVSAVAAAVPAVAPAAPSPTVAAGLEPAPPPTDAAAVPEGGTRADTIDTKQKARWLLQEARAQVTKGNYDEATQKATQALNMGVSWGLFDDTPAKVFEAIEKARPKAVAETTPPQQRDRKTAKAKLKEARTALANNQFDQAEAIAQEVKSWGLSYGMLSDNPDKVAAAARALKRRDQVRSAKVKEQPSQAVYDTLVQEARQLMAAGKWDEAEVKARYAQRMNVVPPVTADRAEAVLHDLAMVRARQTQPAPALAATAPAAAAPAPLPTEVPSVVAEREANALLAKGDDAAASTKFTEADRLRAEESGQPTVETTPTVDSQVKKAEEAAVAPLPAPPEPAAAAPVPPLPAPEAAPAANTPAPTGNRGEQLMNEAKALFSNGNYAAAKQLAQQAKEGKFGIDAQADEFLAQVALAEQGGALSLYEAALDAIRKGDNAHAHALLTEVADSGAALDDGMRQRVQDLLAKLPQAGAGRATATDAQKLAQDGDTLAAQRLNAEVGTKVAEARRLAETDPDKAIALLQETLRSVQAADVPAPLTRPMVRRVEVAIELMKKDKVAFDAKMQDKAQRAEIENKRLRILEADKAKQARMKELMDKATAAMAEEKYTEAEAYAKRAQEIDPDEVAATILAWKARAQRHYKRDLETRAAQQEGALTAFQEVDTAAVMDPEIQMRSIKYATSFKDLTRERLRMNAKLELKKDPKTLAIEAKLNDSVNLNMDKQPLSEAITFLQNYTGLNIVLDPKSLSDEGLTSASPVSLTANNIRLKTALKLMLKPMGLTYKVEDEVLLITSPQASQSSLVTTPYYVGDLVFSPSKSSDNPLGLGPHGPQEMNNLINPNPLKASDVPAQTVATQGGLTVAGGDGPRSVSEGRPKPDFTPLIQLITASIAPGSWRVFGESGNETTAAYGLGGGFGGDAGGIDTTQPIGSITPFFLNISLIIRHTAEIHEQVADLLRQLRRLQDLQVTIEVRFITVSDNFFEQIGVDFDFNIQSHAFGKHSSFAIPLFGPGSNTGIQAIGGTTIGGTTTGGTTGGTTTGGTTSGGTTGGGLGSTGGGGGVGGGFGSVGAGGNLGGSLGGGSGTSGTTTGGTTSGTSTPVVITNPVRDYSIGATPIVVGTAGTGIANFTNNLGIPFTQGSANLIAPSNAVPGAGATFGIAFLSDLEVYLFLTAAQGDQRANILQAPKVTTFNGAAASINNTEQINYVQTLLPIVGPGSVAFFPQTASFPNGVTLFVTPVVSADRRYVRMTLSPFFTALEAFNSIQVPAAVGGAGLGGGGAAINGQINLPQFTVTSVQTTVTVPDGGTVLLGGVKRLNEQRNEFGVPVLSKTPLLDRLFRNIGISRITSSLMLMVTPRIIILEEEEQRLGIPTIAL